MPLSISHFKSFWGLIALLASSLVLGFVGVILYATKGNPETQFWKANIGRKMSWIEEGRAKNEPVIFVGGGSSTAFAIDSGFIYESSGLRVVNGGLPAATGGGVFNGFSLVNTRAGDTLVICQEPGTMFQRQTMEFVAVQIFAAAGNVAPLTWENPERLAVQVWAEHLGDFRPGARHMVFLLAKTAARQPLYRYQIADIQEGGFVTTAVRKPLPENFMLGTDQRPSDETIAMLKSLKSAADARGVRIVYLLPWAYSAPDRVDEARELNRAFLKHIEPIMPIWTEPEMGVYSVAEDFSDSGLHLTEEGAKKRSLRLIETMGGLKN